MQKLLSARWEGLCERFLPIASPDSIWRFSRHPLPEDPQQGWKLHVSATILTANKTLAKVGPYLSERNLLFKAPGNLNELSRLNCGLFYGFSQVGKFMTVYPGSEEDAVCIAQALSRLMSGMIAPAIPYDLAFLNSKCVFYRYGAFGGATEFIDENGSRMPAIRNPAGEAVADRRVPDAAIPEWLTDPFPQPPRRKAAATSPLSTTIRAYEALSQRGKGGVYRALDLSVSPARLCVLKEGRRHGETDWDRRDGFWRVKHEADVLSTLRASGVPVPEVYLTFKSGTHYYLVTEFIEGQNLQSILLDKRKRISAAEALRLGRQVAEAVSQIHSAGWVWRDCKPLNLIASGRAVLRPIDFEGACSISKPDPTPWGTDGYVPPEFRRVPENGLRLPEDLYALGATLQQLLAARRSSKPFPPGRSRKLRPGIPATVRKLILALLDERPESRPSAKSALQVLTRAWQNTVSHKIQKKRKSPIKRARR